MDGSTIAILSAVFVANNIGLHSKLSDNYFSVVRNLMVIFIHGIFFRGDTADRYKIRTVTKKETYTHNGTVTLVVPQKVLL